MKNAAEAFKRQLTLSEKIYGPQSPENTAALMNQGMLASQQKDSPAPRAISPTCTT